MKKISCYTKDPAADFKKANPDLKRNKTYLRHLQVCFLYWILNCERSEVAKITGYSLATLSKLWKEVKGYEDEAEEIFTLNPVEEKNKITITTSSKEVVKTTVRKCGNVSVPMNYLKGYGEDVKNIQQCYLFKFYTNDKSVPVFSKIGTTGKSCNERLRDEIGEYRKKFNIRSVDVAKIIQCGELPAESFESFLRAYLIKDYPNTWKKNDRFFGVDVDTDRFVTLCKMFEKI